MGTTIQPVSESIVAVVARCQVNAALVLMMTALVMARMVSIIVACMQVYTESYPILVAIVVGLSGHTQQRCCRQCATDTSYLFYSFHTSSSAANAVFA